MGNWKSWLLTAAGTFAGGAGGWVTTRLEDGIPSTAVQWKAVGIGAVVAGVVGFANWLRTSPLTGGAS
jgi:hypothetical protein